MKFRPQKRTIYWDGNLEILQPEEARVFNVIRSVTVTLFNAHRHALAALSYASCVSSFLNRIRPSILRRNRGGPLCARGERREQSTGHQDDVGVLDDVAGPYETDGAWHTFLEFDVGLVD
jgi:hypothetical protein